MNMPKNLTAVALAIETVDIAARTQRSPWAITLIKDRKTPDTLCIEMLVPAGTLSTNQDKTLLAFTEFSEKNPSLIDDADTEKALAEFIRTGIDQVTITIDIQHQDTQSLGQFLQNLKNCFNATWDVFVDAMSKPRTVWPNATKVRISLAKTRNAGKI